MEASDESFGIEVVLIPEDKEAPCCPHGRFNSRVLFSTQMLSQTG